ncbi:hypothetical protein CYY_007801 [Polysphondylium violaceum]|uniref:Transmembrane protein n=1 Tax=Polysphondylium violaceum TaxID=133409 RepID=A0A8J4PP89_9MYCE|nr:hypothetical protein CYY_007801 [Polysphondylium violaceum]
MGVSNFYKNKFTTLLIVLIFASMALLIAGLATRWYKIVVYQQTVSLTQEFSFHATKIVRHIIDTDVYPHSGWSVYDLKKTHVFFNAGMAMGAIAFIVGIISLIFVTLKQLGVVTNNIVWHITRGLMVVTFISILCSVSVLSGITNAFKKDYESSQRVTDRFPYCYQACDNKWKGTETNELGDKITFGPGMGWILTVISGVPALFAIVVAFVFKHSDDPLK